MLLIDAIRVIIDHEPNGLARYELLTSIGIDSTNEEIFKACEEIRNELPDDSEALPLKRHDVLRHHDEKENLRDSRENKSDEIHVRESLNVPDLQEF